MIQNKKIFYLAVAVALAGVITRHSNSIGLGDLFASLPSATIWSGIAAALMALSLIPFWSRSRPKKKVHTRRDNLKKEDLSAVADKVTVLSEADKPDIPYIVDYVIFQAIEAGASDIHFDPSRKGMDLRYRIQSMMINVVAIPNHLSSPIRNRLKVISNLVVYKHALPQDGRIDQNSGGNKHELERSGLADSDFRIAFMPTLHGERIVIRILGRGDDHLNFVELGMDDFEQRTMERFLKQPQGMIILTGPTGSGKSTTIYAGLRNIQHQTHAVRSIATLEDPIEFDLEGANQSQVDEAKDFTFAMGLRAILRQDPDVIMVGEIRDPKTAAIAIQAGMTGHLIITTVHAGSTASAFSRLLEMGVATYSLNSAVTAIIAQRLVRKICPNCKRERGMTDHDKADLNMATPPPGFSIFHGIGCEICNNTGYHGRTALFEMLEVNENIRSLITDGASVDKIREASKESGMRTIWDAGLNAVKIGLTTPEEIARVVSKEDR